MAPSGVGKNVIKLWELSEETSKRKPEFVASIW